MMGNTTPLRVLLISEGSGGHLIPALQVARRLLQRGARITLWYVQRRSITRLTRALVDGAKDASINAEAIEVPAGRNPFSRLWQGGQLWSRSQRCFDECAPDVVVGFGGWVSAPVVLAARQRHIGCLLHEQNVVLGRANRWLSHWVDRVAVSFRETTAMLNGTPAVVTGMPVRDGMAESSQKPAARFGFDARRPTILILGGSQGSQAINRILVEVAAVLSAEEQRDWQFLHVTGAEDEAAVKRAYAAHGITAWVVPFLLEMDAAYAQADVVIARAGGSTIAELACCGKPAVLVPYPGAGGHQAANARIVEATGGGIVIEEHEATPARLLGALRRLLSDARLRTMMGAQIRQLAMPDAAEQLTEAILSLRPTRRS